MTPDGKTLAVDDGRLVRVCPACGEQIELEQVVSDVYEVIDATSGVPRTLYLPQGTEPPDGAAARGEHTDYDDTAYRDHYADAHG